MQEATQSSEEIIGPVQAKERPVAKVPRIYFQNFDGIRFFAALLVMIQHLSSYKKVQSVSSANVELPYVLNFGFHGVTLFFVLSGFLIFYLLFVERAYTGTVSIKDFYIRRMLRIWPLYFGFGLLSIFGIKYVLSVLGTSVSTPVAENLCYLVLFGVNLQLVFGTLNRGIVDIYWSVCIEEQFYLFAPWLVKKGIRPLKIALALISIGIISKIVWYVLLKNDVLAVNHHPNPIYTFTTCWFDAFGFGILAAYLHFNKSIFKKIQSVVENRLIQALVLLITILYITDILPRPQIITDCFLSTLTCVTFSYLILAAATGKFLFNFETSFLKRMGRYSYGMYVLNPTILQITLLLCLHYVSRSKSWFYEAIYPLLAISLVVVVAGLSYEIYEKRFLKLKKYFTIVQNNKV